ncbi:RNA-directed DNA polymerase from mobile element jockey-like [Brachionus plicatilis]|uniref:RNA-directed DNA polymerase from mobile element jockey-like n=1 Tax=Brachionus plicatilis TaxID=10195 RepID=A0A3M7RAX9_BRAPC|nr:RNA-directed DNA polymerase from mobile element jockey-like [Brachionus plicatilis]
MTHKCTIAEKLKSIERQKIDYSEHYIEHDSIALLLSSAQILKTPVLEDDLNTLQIPVQPHVQTSIQNVQKDRKKYVQYVQTSNQIKRQSETEQEENDPKKQYLDSADEDDDTFESEMTISTEHHAEQSTNPESKCSMKTYAVTQQPAMVIIHWNCAHLPSKIQLLENFLDQKIPDIPRNKYGGGVAILVNEGIEFIQDFSFDEFSSEILSIKLNYGKNDQFYVFSLYNPPNALLNFDLFEKINRKCTNYILGGDLNARTKHLGCLAENQNGIILEKIINELDFSVINDKTPTFNIFNREYFEILDLFLVSSSVTNKINEFRVLSNQDMISDHFPIETSIAFDYIITQIGIYFVKHFLVASAGTLDEQNEIITKKIISAAQKSIPFQSQKVFKSSLPPFINNSQPIFNEPISLYEMIIVKMRSSLRT